MPSPIYAVDATAHRVQYIKKILKPTEVFFSLSFAEISNDSFFQSNDRGIIVLCLDTPKVSKKEYRTLEHLCKLAHVFIFIDKPNELNFLQLFRTGVKDIFSEDDGELYIRSKLDELTKKERPDHAKNNILQISEQIIDNSPVGLVVLDDNNDVLLWNKKAELLTGKPEKSILGKSFFDLFDILEHTRTKCKFSIISTDFDIEYFQADIFGDNFESDQTYVAFYKITDAVIKEKESERLLHQMVILNDISRNLSMSLDVEGFLEAFSMQLQGVFNPDLSRIFLQDSGSDGYFLASLKMREDYEYNSEDSLNVANSPLKVLLETEYPVIFHSKEEHTEFSDCNLLETLIYIPIKTKDEVVCIVSMGSSKPNFFDEVVLYSLDLLADIVSINFQNVQLYYNSQQTNEELSNTLNDYLDAKDAIEHQAGYLSQLLEETEQARRIIEKQNLDKQRELDKAAELQQALIPERIFENPHCAFESIYIPCNEVAGDIYDIFDFENGKIGILIADVSDHGVSSAMIAAMFKMVFKIYASETESPKEIFTRINKIMHDTITTGDYVTSFFGVYDPESMVMTYCSAGHPASIVCDAFGENMRLLDTDGFFVGMFDFADYEEKTVKLESGDHILMYTDGIYEIKNKADEEYGKERLQENFLITICDMNMFPLSNLLVTAEEYAEGIPYDDDLTMIHVIVK